MREPSELDIAQLRFELRKMYGHVGFECSLQILMEMIVGARVLAEVILEERTKMKQIRTRVWTITCPQCHVEMFSRARHDYRICGCSFQTMVDGGFAGYVRYGGKDLQPLKDSFRYRFVKASKQELYDDWNQRQDKFGVIAKKGAK